MRRVERWRALEIPFRGAQTYDNPYRDLELEVRFTHQSGLELTMPAFWDGGDVWKIRFAPPRLGQWTWKTVCSNPEDAGLHSQAGSVEAVPYTGELSLYKHGFLQVSQNGRYLEHADGTPFFWLGDTHWLGLSAKERFDESNDPRFASQFKGIVERRLEQGYTVWAGSLMLGEWNDASGSPTPLWGTHLEGGQHPWVGTGYQITASSGAHQKDFTAYSEGHAIDGYPDSFWQSKDPSFPQWLRLDLGQPTALARAVLHFPEAESWGFTLEGSNDDQTFEPLFEHLSGQPINRCAAEIAGTFRFLRLTLTASSGSPAAVGGLEVYDQAGKLHGNQNVLKVLNPPYWQLLDRRIEYLAERGMLLNLGLDWGRNLQQSSAMLEDYKRVARYVLARYGAYPTVFFTAGEPQQSPYFEGWKNILTHFHDLDPYQRPATLHAFKPVAARGFKENGLELKTPIDRAARGFAFTHLQTEEYGQGAHHLEEWRGEYAATPTMPMIEAETGYEKEPGDGYEQRWAAWQSFMAGACGYTYGAYGIWSATWDDHDRWNEFGTHTNWFEAVDFAGGEQMRHYAAFLRSLEWWRLEPYPSFVSWPAAPSGEHQRPLAKATPDGSLIVAYLPRSEAPYGAVLEGLPRARYRVEWFDPRDGSRSEPLSLEPSAGTLRSPPKPDADDWVLLLAAHPR